MAAELIFKSENDNTCLVFDECVVTIGGIK